MAAYYDKRQRKWYCQFQYTDWTGARKRTTKRGFATKKEALAYEADFKNTASTQPDMTLNFLAEKYLEDYMVNNRYTSYVTIKRRLHNHILPMLGNEKITDITPNTIREWQNELKRQEMGESITKSANLAFSALLNFAVKYYGLNKNPFSVTGTTGRSLRKMSFWEPDDFKAVDAVMDKESYRVAINVLYWSGMRIGELEGLKAEDIDFEANTITIKRTYDSSLHTLNPPKTQAGNRTIAMPPTIMAMVKALFDKAVDLPEFPLRTCHSCTLRFYLTHAAEKAGVKRITPHDLRHSHASFLIHQGVAITAISKRLGHSSPAMTLSTYAHCFKESDSEIAGILENVVKTSSEK